MPGKKKPDQGNAPRASHNATNGTNDNADNRGENTENNDPDLVLTAIEDGMMNAPRQDPNERRDIRKKYSIIKEDLQANREDLIRPDNEGLHAKLTETENQFKRVQEPREAALDSGIVHLISNLAKQQVQALHTDFCVFDPIEFSQKLITLIAGNQLNDLDRERVRLSRDGWVKLGEAAQPFYRRSPALHCMFGTFEKGPPVKKVKVPRPQEKKDENTAKGPTEPKQLASFKELDANQEVTTQEVERVYTILQQLYHHQQTPICYFSLVTNPDSFGHTIENLFHVSFLVRDGLARISLDEDQLPVIEPVEQADENRESVSRAARHQVVMSLTTSEWKEIVKSFEISEAMIPPREPPSPGVGGGTDGGGGNQALPSTSSNGTGGTNKKPRR